MARWNNSEDSTMTQTITTHITEYQKQIESLTRNIIALQGAIQALERLAKEQASEVDSQEGTEVKENE